MSPCCQNRKQIYGVYPRDSIRASWTSARAVELRRAVEKWDFSKGCKPCLDEIKAKNFLGVQAYWYDKYADYPIDCLHKCFANQEKHDWFCHYPKMLDFEISNLCNLECLMCTSFWSSTIEKREEGKCNKSPYDENFVNEIAEFIPNVELIRFFGGEPFLISAYYNIFEMLIKHNRNARVMVTTNGTILNEKVVRLIDNLTCHINFSLDSLDKELFEKIRKNAKFEDVIEHLEFCIKKRNEGADLDLGLSVCPLSLNLHEMADLIQFANERDLAIYFNTVVFPPELVPTNLPRQRLNEILSAFRKMKLPEKTLFERLNKSALEGLINRLTADIAAMEEGK